MDLDPPVALTRFRQRTAAEVEAHLTCERRKNVAEQMTFDYTKSQNTLKPRQTIGFSSAFNSRCSVSIVEKSAIPSTRSGRKCS